MFIHLGPNTIIYKDSQDLTSSQDSLLSEPSDTDYYPSSMEEDDESQTE
jgi:hypothetical protein